MATKSVVAYPDSLSGASAARLLGVAVWGGICLGIVMAPVLAAGSHGVAAGVLYIIFSPVCHQIPERSFMFSGHAFAVCHRCSGIYFGLLIGSLPPLSVYAAMLRGRRRGVWVLSAAAPLVADALLGAAGLWSNTVWSRTASGFLFGIMLSSLLLYGMAELWDQAPRIKTHPCVAQGNGGSR